MNLKSASGLTLVELVVIVSLFLVLLMFIPGLDSGSGILSANMTAVGCRGKDVWVAITAANAEREALGLSPLWPRDFDPAVDTNAEALLRLDVETSTDYFRWLIDEKNINTPEWNPPVAGLDFSKLAGAGVRCAGKRLAAENTLWTVAKNVRGDLDDIVPVLVTRNIDASSLAARMMDQDKTKVLRFDPAWETPFGNKAFVLIRKGGAIFKARPKYMSYGVVYQNQAFDATRAADGSGALPLKYLTPTREVTPGDQAYAEGAAVAYQLAGGRWGQLKREALRFVRVGMRFALFFAPLYVILFARSSKKCKRLGMRPMNSAPIIGVWICHWFAVTFYAAFLLLPLTGSDFGKPWLYGAAALVAQALGVALALVFQRHDPETRRRQVKWLLAPVWIVLACLAVLACLMVMS